MQTTLSSIRAARGLDGPHWAAYAEVRGRRYLVAITRDVIVAECAARAFKADRPSCGVFLTDTFDSTSINGTVDDLQAEDAYNRDLALRMRDKPFRVNVN